MKGRRSESRHERDGLRAAPRGRRKRTARPPPGALLRLRGLARSTLPAHCFVRIFVTVSSAPNISIAHWIPIYSLRAAGCGADAKRPAPQRPLRPWRACRWLGLRPLQRATAQASARVPSGPGARPARQVPDEAAGRAAGQGTRRALGGSEPDFGSASGSSTVISHVVPLPGSPASESVA